jgi:hypothetical protein
MDGKAGSIPDAPSARPKLLYLPYNVLQDEANQGTLLGIFIS